jgi:hypothetical protein
MLGSEKKSRVYITHTSSPTFNKITNAVADETTVTATSIQLLMSVTTITGADPLVDV